MKRPFIHPSVEVTPEPDYNEYGVDWYGIGQVSEDSLSVQVSLGNGVGILGATDGNIYRTSDYGRTWRCLGDTTVGNILSGAYLGNGIVIIGTSAAAIYKSVDYGMTWTAVGAIPAAGALNAICYLGNGVVVVGDTNGKVYRSTNRASTFTDLGVVAVDQISGFCNCGNGIVIMGVIAYLYRSIDNGLTWTSLGAQTNPLGDSISEIDNLGNGIVLAQGGYRHVLRSINYGLTWTDMGEVLPGRYYGAVVIGSTVVLATGTYIYRSLDKGITWESVGRVTHTVSTSLDGIMHLGDGVLVAVYSASVMDRRGYVLRSEPLEFPTWTPVNNHIERAESGKAEGTATVDYATALDIDARGFRDMTFIVKNTDGAEALDYKVLVRYTDYTGGADEELQAEQVLLAGEMGLVTLEHAYSRILIQMKRDAATDCDYEITYLLNK